MLTVLPTFKKQRGTTACRYPASAIGGDPRVHERALRGIWDGLRIPAGHCQPGQMGPPRGSVAGGQHSRFLGYYSAPPRIGSSHANHVPPKRRLLRIRLYARAITPSGKRLTPFEWLFFAASGTGQASVWIHQTSKRHSQAPFKNVKGAVQRVAFHPLKPQFFVAVITSFFFLPFYHFPPIPGPPRNSEPGY